MALTSAAVLAPIHRAFCKNSWQRKNWCHWAATVFCPSPPANQASRVDSPALLEPCDNSDNSKSNEISWMPRIYTYIYNIIHIYICVCEYQKSWSTRWTTQRVQRHVEYLWTSSNLLPPAIFYLHQGSDKGGGVVQMILVDTKRNA